MKEFLKKVVSAVYTSVVVHYKSTLVGLGLAVAIVVVDQLAAALAGVSSPYAPVVAALVAFAGAALRKKAAEYPTVPVEPPKVP